MKGRGRKFVMGLVLAGAALGLLLLNPGLSEADTWEVWQEVVESTRVSSSNNSLAASLGVDSADNVHVAWVDRRNGNWEVYYTKLDNNGNTLVDDTRVTSAGGNRDWPSLGVDSSDNVHIAWEDYRDGNWEVYYTKLDNNGNIVVDDTRVTSDSSSSYSPSLGVDSDGNVHIAWRDYRSGSRDIYYTKLDNNGNTVVDDTRVTSNAYNEYPSLGVDSAGNVHIAWLDRWDDIYYTKLDNNGNTVVDDTKLTSGNNNLDAPSLGVDGSGNVHIAWMENWDSIYYTKLNNDGNTVVENTRVTSEVEACWSADLGVDSDGNVHISWWDYRDAGDGIYYLKLDNNGNTLVKDTWVAQIWSCGYEPSLGVDSNGNIHIVWEDRWGSSWEIFYTKGTTFVCLDTDGDGSAIEGGACGPIDCDETDPNIHPGAVELCDGVDNDCDDTVDEDEVWQDVVDDTNLSSGSYGSEPSLGVDSSGNIHIAWSGTQSEIYYTQLDNAGNTLVEDTRLTSDSSASHEPSLGVDSAGNVHIAWRDRRDGNYEIYYTKLDNNGNTVVDDTRLTSDSASSSYATLGVDSSGNVHVAWMDKRDGDYEIYYTKLDNNGNTVVDDTRLSSASPDGNWEPSLGVDSSGNIHIVWDKWWDIYYIKLDNNGNVVVGTTKLSSGPGEKWYPSMGVASSGNIHVSWQDNRDGNWELYYAMRDNSGNALVGDTRLTFDSDDNDLFPSLGVDSSDNVHIAWRDRRDGNYEIYYTKLDNNGNTIVEDTRLTSDSAWNSDPSLGVDSSDNIHIAWRGNEIYYTQGKTNAVCYTFGGFLQPINSDGSSVFNVGRTIPVKIILTDGNGESIPTATVEIELYRITEQGEEQINLADNLFEYNAETGEYVYILKTKDYTVGAYKVYALPDDGSSHSVTFLLE